VTEGFYVDLGALTKATEGVTDTINAMATKKVSDIDAPKDAFGHDGLADTVGSFCERWQIGVENLIKDAQEVAQRLNDSLNAYVHVDRVVQDAFDGPVQRSTGPDPAAQ
jgi:hypothetical protein